MYIYNTLKTYIMNIYKKLFEAKKEIGKISKDSTNPFFKSKYFDINALLEHVEPILQKHDLLILQPIKNGLVTTQIVDSENGSMVESEIALTNITDPQKRGSEITYYRRYTLQSLLGLQAEDDDGNKASQKAKPETKVEPKPENKPMLSDKGFKYLMDKGTPQDIQTALKTRTMTPEQTKQLTDKL